MIHRSLFDLRMLVFMMLLCVVCCGQKPPGFITHRLHEANPVVIPQLLELCAENYFRNFKNLLIVNDAYSLHCYVLRSMLLSNRPLITLDSIELIHQKHARHLPPSLEFSLSLIGFLPLHACEWELSLTVHDSTAGEHTLLSKLVPLGPRSFDLSSLPDVYRKVGLSDSRSWKAVVASVIAVEVILNGAGFACQPPALIFKGTFVGSRFKIKLYMNRYDFVIHSIVLSNRLNNQNLQQEFFGPAAKLFQNLEFGDGEIIYVTSDSPVDFFHQFFKTHHSSGFTLQSTVAAKAEANNLLGSYLGLDKRKSDFVACIKGNIIAGDLMMDGLFKSNFFTYAPKVSFEANFLNSHFLVKYEGKLIFGHKDNGLKFQVSMTDWWNPNGGSIPLFSFTHDKNRPENEDFLGLKMSFAFDPFHVSIAPENLLQANFYFDAKVAIQGISSFKQAHISIDLAGEEKSFCLFQNLLIKELNGFFLPVPKLRIFAKDVAELSLSNFQVMRKECKFGDVEYSYFGQSTGWSWGFTGAIDMYMTHNLFTFVLRPVLRSDSSSSSIAADSSEQNRFAFHIDDKGEAFIVWSHFKAINPDLKLKNGNVYFSGTTRIFNYEITLDGYFTFQGSNLGTFSATINGESFRLNLFSYFSKLQIETNSGNSQFSNARAFVNKIVLHVFGDLDSNSLIWKIEYNNGDVTVAIPNLTPNLRNLDDFLSFVKSNLEDPFRVFCSKKRSLVEGQEKSSKRPKL